MEIVESWERFERTQIRNHYLNFAQSARIDDEQGFRLPKSLTSGKIKKGKMSLELFRIQGNILFCECCR